MGRTLVILRVFSKYHLSRFFNLHQSRRSWKFLPLQLLFIGLDLLGKILGRHPSSKEEALRRALEELGPIFIKFGQILSTRSDLLAPELVEQLSYLQDRVTPCPTEQITDILRDSLGDEIQQFFSEFEHTSAAAASVAQVHFAVLRKEQVQVAVKVIKPGIHEAVQRDLKFLYTLAKLITKFFAASEKLRLTEIVAEFEYVLENELNMQQEGANASQLRRNFKSPADSKLMRVPKIYWDYSSKQVLVMERIYGVAINDLRELKRRQVDLRALAENGVKIFFTQVFRDSFFHADMHPGNVFVDLSDPAKPVYNGVDFGIMGSLAPADKKYLALNLLAFFAQDYRRVAELHINCGWVSRTTRVEQLEAAVRGVCEPIFAKPINEIPFGQVLTQLLHTARKFNMQVQPQLLLLQKTLINVEGLGRELYPQLNIWETSTPILKKWLAQEVGVKNLAGSLQQLYPELLLRLPNFIEDLASGVHNLAQTQPDAQTQNLTKLRRQLRHTKILLWLSLVTLGAFLAIWRLNS